jgi:hypothetical protein
MTVTRRPTTVVQNLVDGYDTEAAKRRLLKDAARMPRPQELRRPRINTFRVYDPTRPIASRRPAQATLEPDVYADAPAGESFWLMFVGALGLLFSLWLLLWVVSLS